MAGTPVYQVRDFRRLPVVSVPGCKQNPQQKTREVERWTVVSGLEMDICIRSRDREMLTEPSQPSLHKLVLKDFFLTCSFCLQQSLCAYMR